MWNIRVAVLVAVVHIGPAMVVEISARPFDSVVEAAPLYLIPAALRSIPRPFRNAHFVSRSAHQVGYANVISAAKPFAICVTIF
jgi:hypothetical protein